MENICIDCFKKFTTKSSLTRHRKTCPHVKAKISLEIKNTELVTQLAKLTQLNIQLKEQITTLEIKHKEELLQLEAKHKEELFQLEKQLAYKDGEQSQIQPQLAQLDRFEAHILKENSKPRITNNVVNNLAPYPTSPVIQQAIQKYTEEHFLAGPETTHNFLVDEMLTDEKGRPRVACTDIARNIFKGKTEDGTEIVDVGGKRLQKDIINPLKKTIRKTSRNLESSGDWDEDELEAKTVSHMRALAPKNVTKRLAGELRSSAPAGVRGQIDP